MMHYQLFTCCVTLDMFCFQLFDTTVFPVLTKPKPKPKEEPPKDTPAEQKETQTSGNVNNETQQTSTPEEGAESKDSQMDLD